MDSINYKKLYELQDKILDIVFEQENIFYLTDRFGSINSIANRKVDYIENFLNNFNDEYPKIIEKIKETSTEKRF